MNKIDVKKQLTIAKNKGEKIRLVGFIRVCIGCDLITAKNFVDEHWHEKPKDILRELYSGGFGYSRKQIEEIVRKYDPSKNPTFIYQEIYDEIEKRRKARAERKVIPY
jgi:predicted nucleic acid-binding protein